MRNRARKIIEAIQHTTLDRLYVQLFPVLAPLAFFWSNAGAQPDIALALVIFAVFAAIFFPVLILSTIAHAPSKAGALRESRTLNIWDTPPPDGLRPPAPIAAVIRRLGGARHSWLALIVSLAGLLAAVTLAMAPTDFLATIHPALAEPAVRQNCVGVIGLIMILLTIRSWATNQRIRLAQSDL